MKLKVTYDVRYECSIDVPDNGMDGESLLVDARWGDLHEEIVSDIDIPEGGKHGSTYVPLTFHLLAVDKHDEEAK